MNIFIFALMLLLWFSGIILILMEMRRKKIFGILILSISMVLFAWQAKEQGKQEVYNQLTQDLKSLQIQEDANTLVTGDFIIFSKDGKIRRIIPAREE